MTWCCPLGETAGEECPRGWRELFEISFTCENLGLLPDLVFTL